MTAVVIVGAQWGDEGKGKVVDIYAEEADIVVRHGGGANAGHTLVIDGEKLVTHLVPSGILHPGTLCVLGNGMVVDPDTLLEEIAQCKARGRLADEDLLISSRAHVILPYHQAIEARREKSANALGTTLRGIGPAYEAKAARRGVRMGDLLRPARLRALVEQNLAETGALIRHLGGTPPDVDEIVDAALAAGEKLARYMGNVGDVIERALSDGKNVLFEGAQGSLLDLDHGTYPFVTSSATVAAGACLGVGIGPTRIDRVVGISKAYTTRVGGGPFPTELDAVGAARLREAGGEFGATTGRPRRCGWLDVPALRYAARLNGLAGIALMKLDVLSDLPEVQVCVAYELDGQLLDEIPMDAEDLARVVPAYRTFPGWQADLTMARAFDDLPENAQSYVRAVEELVGVEICLVSVGAERSQAISLRSPFAV